MRSVASWTMVGWLLMGITAAWSAQVDNPEQAGTTYSIIYEASAFETQTIKNVMSFKVMSLGSKEFLAFEQQVLKLRVRGYLDLKQVRAILPAGVAPERVTHAPQIFRLPPESEPTP